MTHGSVMKSPSIYVAAATDQGRGVLLFPQLHTFTGQAGNAVTANTPAGGKRAVIRGSVSVIPMCGVSDASPSFSQQEAVAPAPPGSWAVSVTGNPQSFPQSCAPGRRCSGLRIRRCRCAEDGQFLTWSPGLWPPRGEGVGRTILES